MASLWLSSLLGTLRSTFGVGAPATRATLDTSGLTAPRTFDFPDASGTLALTSDISGAAQVYTRITATGDIRATAGYADLRSTE
jgi:hypothetical protein